MLTYFFSLYTFFSTFVNKSEKKIDNNVNVNINGNTEFHRQCADSIESSIEYAKKNLLVIANREKIDTFCISNSFSLLIAPKWSFSAFGQYYVVRLSFYGSHHHAWIVPKKESDELDALLKNILQKSDFFGKNLTLDDIDIHLGKIIHNIRDTLYKTLDVTKKI